MIEVKNINLSVKHVNKRGNRYILKNVSATFEPRKINAIMGPSGGGKTSLLNLMYGKCERTSLTSGSILYNGSERNPIQWYRDVSLVEQQNLEVETKTPEEALRDVMDLHSKIPDDRFDRIVQGLQIEKILSTQISSLSGGERKRVFIAMALMSTSKIILLDEPVSDLDSQLALSLMTFIKKLAIEQDLTIVAIIHQPSPLLFELFDNLLFLYEGHPIYSSSVKGLEDALKAKGLPVVPGFTVAEFLLEVFSPSSSFENIECLKPQVSKCFRELEDVWNSSLFKFTENKSTDLDFETVDFKCVYRLLVNSPYFSYKNFIITFVVGVVLGLLAAFVLGKEKFDPVIYEKSRLLYNLMRSFEVFNVISLFYDLIHPQMSLRELINFRNNPNINNVTKEIFYSMFSMSSFYFANIAFMILNQLIFFLPFWIIFMMTSSYSFGYTFILYFLIKSLAHGMLRLFFKNIIVFVTDRSKSAGAAVYGLIVAFVAMSNFSFLYDAFMKIDTFQFPYKLSKFLIKFLNPLFSIDLALTHLDKNVDPSTLKPIYGSTSDEFLNPFFKIRYHKNDFEIVSPPAGSEMSLVLPVDENVLYFSFSTATENRDVYCSPESLSGTETARANIPVVNYAKLLSELLISQNYYISFTLYVVVFAAIIYLNKLLMTRNFSTSVRMRL